MDKEKDKCIGVIVCRLDTHGHAKINRGYIAMLAVSKEYRKRKIGSTLALMAIQAMKDAGADEVCPPPLLGKYAFTVPLGARGLSSSIAFLNVDRAGDRVHEYERHRTVSANGIYKGQTTLPVLSQWRRCLPVKIVLQAGTDRSQGTGRHGHRHGPHATRPDFNKLRQSALVFWHVFFVQPNLQ